MLLTESALQVKMNQQAGQGAWLMPGAADGCCCSSGRALGS